MPLAGESEKLGKAFVEWTMHALGIPDEMADSKRCEILTGVPGGQAGDAAVTLVLPDLPADAKRIEIGDVNG